MQESNTCMCHKCISRVGMFSYEFRIFFFQIVRVLCLRWDISTAVLYISISLQGNSPKKQHRRYREMVPLSPAGKANVYFLPR